MKVKIFGAGSIGNHLANASRRLSWNVDIYDINDDALLRTKNEIYPNRYGEWDESINLYNVNSTIDTSYDLIIVGTPPDSHISVATAAIDEKPKAILIEKPLSTPDLKGLDELVQKANDFNVRLFIGYDHVVGSATDYVSDLYNNNDLGEIKTIDVNFREHWGGIFAAHPWLSGPKDSYLGFWKRGGGAIGEHSHGINLWQYFAHINGKGRVNTVSAITNYNSKNETDYDDISLINVKTEKGLIGRIVQDVITFPPIKSASLTYESGRINWKSSISQGKDLVELIDQKGQVLNKDFTKTRPDDFIRELEHIKYSIESNSKSPIDIERGIETMLVIAAVHKSSKEQRSVKINYDKGFNFNSIV